MLMRIIKICLAHLTISKVDRNFDRVIGSEKFIECDTLLLSVGLIPENELSREAGAKTYNLQS
ncbi:hypothetical protein LCGC14_0753820 [marine sediment metagenome]|uniref:FAD/NAD(P)-binding domain-containing protein n=1 Tax=marine sediment metagenome TaxID=412755 RepID=A0A0F9Q388_9ZZZZ